MFAFLAPVSRRPPGRGFHLLLALAKRKHHRRRSRPVNALLGRFIAELQFVADDLWIAGAVKDAEHQDLIFFEGKVDSVGKSAEESTTNALANYFVQQGV